MPYINGLCLIAINPDSLCGSQKFKDLMDDLCAYQTSSPAAPGYNEVVMPGTYDFRTKEERSVEGIPVAKASWEQMLQIAERVGVKID